MKQIFAAIRELFAYSVSSVGFVISGTFVGFGTSVASGMNSF